MNKNLNVGPRAEEKFENAAVDLTKSSKNGTEIVSDPSTLSKVDSHLSCNRIRPKQKWTICYWRLFL